MARLKQFMEDQAKRGILKTMSVSVETWNYEKYRELPDDGIRYEVLEGHLYVTPAPSTYHQLVSRRIQFLFYELERSGQGQIYNAPVDLLIPGAEPAQPDLVYLTAEQEAVVTRRGIEGVPELVVEILSPSTAKRDRVDKLHIYRKAGVRRYLIVDIEARTIEVFLLSGAHYMVEAALGPESRVVFEDYGVSLDVEEIFRGIPERED